MDDEHERRRRRLRASRDAESPGFASVVIEESHNDTPWAHVASWDHIAPGTTWVTVDDEGRRMEFRTDDYGGLHVTRFEDPRDDRNDDEGRHVER